MDFENLKKYSPVLLRIALSLVFLWFGINQLIFPNMFLGYIPSWITQNPIIPLEPGFIIMGNGIFEIVFGILLIAGLFTRLVSLFLGLHLIGIMLGLGYNDIAVRDFGLMLATISITLNGPDIWCLDNRHKKKV